MIMTTLKIFLGTVLFLGIMCVNNPEICLTSAAVALGWVAYENKRAKEARR